MPRTMYDSVVADHLPTGGDLYLAYVDGVYRNVDQVRSRFPDKLVVTVTVLGGDADIADCENGDLTPASSVAWVRRQRAAGKDPTVYTMEAEWDTCRAAFASAGEPEPHWFIAHYANKQYQPLPAGFVPSIPAGAVACQYGGDLPGNYDASIVADYWPGIDKGDDEVTDQDKQDIINGVVAALAGPPTVAGTHLDLAQVLGFIQGDPFNGAKFDLNHLAQLIVKNKS